MYTTNNQHFNSLNKKIKTKKIILLLIILKLYKKLKVKKYLKVDKKNQKQAIFSIKKCSFAPQNPIKNKSL